MHNVKVSQIDMVLKNIAQSFAVYGIDSLCMAYTGKMDSYIISRERACNGHPVVWGLQSCQT